MLKRFLIGVLLALLPVVVSAQATVSSSGGGVGLANTNVWTGANSFWDTLFTIIDDGDNTKKIAFQASGITTGTTRTLTVPDADFTLAGLSLAQSWSATNTYSGNTGQISFAGHLFIGSRTQQTPDAPFFATGATANHVLLVEAGDVDFDFAHPLQTNPTLFIHSANQSTTQWVGLTHDGTNGVINVGTGSLDVPNTIDFNVNGTGTIINTGSPKIEFFNTGGLRVLTTSSLQLATSSGGVETTRFLASPPQKALTDAVATAFVQVSAPNSSMYGGTITYSVQAADATNSQSRSGVIPFSVATTSAGVETCTVGTVTTATEVVAVTSGTLTNTFTCATTPANAVNFLANATSSLTETTLQISWQIQLNTSLHTVTITPQ